MIFTFKDIKKLERFHKSSTFSIRIFLCHFSQLPVLSSWWPLPWQIKKSSCCQRNSLFRLSFGTIFSHLSSSSIHIIDSPLCFTFCLSPFSLYLHFCVILLCIGIAVIKYVFSRLKKRVNFVWKTQSKMKFYNISSVPPIPEAAPSAKMFCKCSLSVPSSVMQSCFLMLVYLYCLWLCRKRGGAALFSYCFC